MPDSVLDPEDRAVNKGDKLFSVLRELTSHAETRIKYGACHMVVVMEKNRAGKGDRDLRLEGGVSHLPW